MTKEARSPKRRRIGPAGVPLALRISVFFRHSSFGFGHYPVPSRFGGYAVYPQEQTDAGAAANQSPIFVLELSNSFYRMKTHYVGEIDHPGFPAACHRRGPVSLRIVYVCPPRSIWTHPSGLNAPRTRS